MNLGRRRGHEDPEINLTSMIDVLLMLLLFFIMSTTFIHTSALRVELPTASAKPVPEQADSVEIVIDAKGHFFLNRKELVNDRPDTVKQALKQAIAGRTKVPLVIAADGRTPHQAVVTAMDAAAQLGIRNLTIATTRPTGQD
ncbi:MAG: hypothetical protein B7Z66_14260 [Chromatiales bacterium 21-64-14]|nr:MAG: hypothetical protein B7Z66_14260 [Chromatiales bacterium 21-64-14]HQU16814.1 biopolymer transporter ExbD [Gammaproteobacteria bacterium]